MNQDNMPVIEQGDASTFILNNTKSSKEFLHAILRGLSQNTIKYRQNTLLNDGGSIVFADGSGLYPHKILTKLISAENL